MPQGAIIDSAHSAPNVWMTQLNSDYTNDEISNLLSPFINFQASVGAELSFWYNSDLIPDDGVSLQYSVNNGVWFDLGYVGDPLATNWYTNSLSGNHFWSGQTSGWVKATYDLSQFDNYNTLVQFRFHFFSNISSTADGFAIDDFSIILPPIANDAGVIAINAPTGPTVVGSTGNMIAVTVKNFGTNTLNSIPIKYSINGTSVVTETMTISNGLAPDSTATYSFTTSFQGPISDYRLCAYTALTGDTHRYNDSACVSLGILTAPLDVAITKITPSTLFGNGSTNTGAPTFVKVQIKNLGTQAVTNFPLEYNINQAITVVDTFAGNILPGDSADFTFTQSYQSPIGMYMLCVESQLANDGNPTNDKLCNSYNGLYNAIGDADEQSFYIGQNQPNPASTAVNIPCFLYKSGQLNFELRNTLGQVVQSETIQGFSGEQYLTIDVHQLQAGVYFYTIEFDGKQITHRMIINK
jgi:hypothetical protein